MTDPSSRSPQFGRFAPPKKSLPANPAPVSPRVSPRSSPLPSPRVKRAFGDPWRLRSAHAIALFKFDGDELRLPMNPGDRLRIEEEGYGWFKGLNMDTACVGIFPVSYVAVLPEGLRDQDTVPSPTDEVLVRASQALREWGSLMNAWMREHRFDKAKAIRSHIVAVLKAKETFLNPKTTPEERKSLRKLIWAALTKCTAELGLNLLVAGSDGIYADSRNASPIDLYRLYCAADSGYLASQASAADTGTTTLLRSATSAATGSSVASSERSKNPAAATFVQVFLKYNAFICKVDEENDSSVELFFSLYSLQKKRDITEAYVVQLTSRLMVQDLDGIDLQKTVFSDVELADTLLVCRVIRVGKLSVRQKTTTRFRIPFGIAVVPIAVVLKERNSYFSSQLPIYRLPETGSLSSLMERIVRNDVSPAPGSGVALEIRVYNNTLAALHYEVPELARVAVTNMLDMDTRNIRPGTVRNDFYLTLERGEFQQEGKKTAKNVEVSVTVRSVDGQLVSGALASGASGTTMDEFRTTVYYHDNQPVWAETIRVVVDAEVLPRCHILVEARHSTTKDEKKGKLFSLGSLPLAHGQGIIVPNGSHQIALYKPLPKAPPRDASYYLRPDQYQLKLSRESITVTTTLASTKMIQNAALYKLLHWESYEGELMEVLKKFTFVDTIDLVKVLGDLFPALFSMMDARSDLRMFIFDALSYLIALLVTGRFDAFAPIVDAYFDSQFADPNSYHHILSCLTQYFRNFSDPDLAKPFREALRGLQYWFKIITKSKACETITPDADQFVRELESLMTLVNDLLRSKERANVGAQMLTLKAFDDLLFRSIGPFFSDMRFSRLLLNLLGSLEYDEARPTVNMEKLQVIHSILMGPVFTERLAVRNAVLPVVITEIHLHLTKSPAEFAKCMELLAIIFSKIHTVMRVDGTRVMPFANECAVFIPHLTHAISKLGPSSALDHAIVAFLTLFHVLPREAVVSYFNTLAGSKVKDLLTQVLRTVMFLLKRSLPRNWFALNVFQAETIVSLLQSFRHILMARIKSFPKEIALWTAFLELMFALLTLPQLQLEHLTESKRQLMLRRYGDLRVEAALVLRKTWAELKVLQSIFVPKFVPHFLSLVMLRQPDVREIGVEMYWAVLWREIEDTVDSKIVGSATIDNLNQLSQDDDAPLDFVDFEKFFMGACRDRLGSARRSGCKKEHAEAGEAFLSEIGMLLSLVRRVKTLPPGPEFEEERVLATMDLMTHLRSTNHREVYIRHVQELSEMLGESGSFLEAGMALLLHADMVEWSDTSLSPPLGSFPEESSTKRKERLLLRAVDLFSNAKQWERAIPLLRTLATHYETVTYNYEALADVLHRQGDMFRQIAATQRFFANYFRVGFYGGACAESVRGRQFIFKGFELESLPDFTTRLLQVYRKAEILKTTTVTPEVESSEGMYLLITAVLPASKEEMEGRKRVFPSAMSINAQRFHENDRLSVFVYSKPTKGECVAAGDVADPQIKEFASLWVQKNYMETAESFPTFYKRMEVVRTHVVSISPIQNAVADMETKNASLAQLTAQVERDADPGQLGPLSMALNGIIDAAVNGGTKIYTQLFLSPGYVASRPGDAHLCELLRTLLVSQVELTGAGLRVHRALCPESLQGLQAKMDEFFVTLERNMTPFGYVAPVVVSDALSSPRGRPAALTLTTDASNTLSSSASATPSLPVGEDDVSAGTRKASSARTAGTVSKTRPTAPSSAAGAPPELRRQKSANAVVGSSTGNSQISSSGTHPLVSPRKDDTIGRKFGRKASNNK